MNDTVTLTLNPALDRSARVEHITPDDKLRCYGEHIEAGGGGINVSRMISVLGGGSDAIFTSGGPIGVALQELLNQAHISNVPLPIKTWTRESFVVIEDVSRKEFRFNMEGPNFDPSDAHTLLENILHRIVNARYLVLSGSLPPGLPEDFYKQVLQNVDPKSTKVFLDTSGPGLKAALASHVYLIKPNLREFRALVGLELTTEHEQIEAAQAFVAAGNCEVLALSMGSAGALVVSKEMTERFWPPIVTLKSTVGAGDSMLAGIVFQLQEGSSLHESIRYGMACGAAAITTTGTGFDDKCLVDRLLPFVKYQTLND